MENTITLAQIPSILKKNWFKILAASLLLFLFFKKDLSIQFNINSPELKNSPAKITPVQKEKKKKEFFSEDKKTVRSSAKKALGGILFSNEKNEVFNLETELSKVDKDTKVAYLKRFAHVAIAESKKFGVPPSIVLSNALLNSFAGNRPLAIESNNHFAIPCSTDWSLSTATFEGACYRKYENAWASFRDHSQYITSGRFASLKNLHKEDYKGWARGLDKGGFSADPNFDKQLIKIIESYSLNQLDKK